MKNASLMKKLINGYKKMSGDKKVRLGLDLSQLARQVRAAGKLATGR